MAKAEQQSVEDFKGQAAPAVRKPKRYVISLRVDLARCAFSGSSTIAVAVVSSTRFLVLNAPTSPSTPPPSASLPPDPPSVLYWMLTMHNWTFSLLVLSPFISMGPEFDSCILSSYDELKPSEVVAVEEDEILVVGFDTTLPIGDGELRIGFTGTLNDQMRGFYRSKYEYNGEIRNMAVTQFEAVDARRCFPCWDEPAFKATFKITLEVPSELVALSNMPVAEEKVDGVVKTLSFEESPIMSTYLVAIVVGLFDYIEDNLPDGTKVRVYCQVGKSSQGKFALDVAVKSLQLYENYFAVPYPLPKLDMVAIPDFAAGAMENYGLVTYRETALLYDDRLSSASNKQSVAITVAHELAHQWFGNLVTMEWWTHLWLNEGFASWVSYLAVDSLFPEWKIWTQFLEETAAGLMLDALSESHPIEVTHTHT
ncbi:Aminopeptidase M1-B [Ananas comosus]|uniref:Aminopeptidase M1-B n=1 Tax=Ananas comosus TaxID=4615 RepID=A0A199V2G4_ANACO|nr:Aminopeptidase M1-B [Ananas comosus]